MHQSFLRMLVVTAFTFFSLNILGCEEEGPLEKAGKKADEAIEEVQEEAEEAAEEMEESVEEQTNNK